MELSGSTVTGAEQQRHRPVGRRLPALVTGAVLTLVLASSARAGWDEGLSAYKGGDFLGAILNWLPLARNGDARAQEMLGFMYDLGEGVPENDWVASTWYKAAAEQGATDAQLNLGVLLADGDGVRRDEVEAYKWLELASRAKEEEVRRVALDLLVTLSGRMTETQIGVARKLVREWEQRQLVRNPR